MLTVLLPITREWTREAVCAAIAASDIPRDRAILVYDAAGCEAWGPAFVSLGFRVEVHYTGNSDVVPDARMPRRPRHNRMREFTLGIVPDGELLILDDDTLVPVDVYARLKAAGPHATGIQVSRHGNDLCGVYRGGRPLREGHGVESVERCGHYCLLTTGEMYRATAVHDPAACSMRPIPRLKADWDCVVGHLTERGVLWPDGRAPVSEQIPRIIYCTWKDEDLLPDQKRCMESWKKHLPDYEIRLVTDKGIRRSRCTDAMLAQGKPVTAAQYECWSRLYETGGLYLDFDVNVIKPLDELLKLPAFIGVENDGGRTFWASCGILGARQHHPVIREALDYMDAFDYTDTRVENKLGPQMWTLLLEQHGWKRRDDDTVVADVHILRSERFYPYSWMQKRGGITKDTFAEHEWHYSWKHKTSIVIPCYNQSAYLSEAIESALEQTEPALDIIVVDDGSTDDTAKVASRYPVTLIRQKNRGVSAARNAGIAKAAGMNIVCLDADDRLQPEFVAKLAGLDDIVSCDLQMFGARKGRWVLPLSNPRLGHFMERNQVLSGALFRKAYWAKVGGYDETMRDGLEDWDFWARCVAAGASVHIIHEPLFDYRTYDRGERTLNSNSFENARTNYAGLATKMRAKWAALGMCTGTHVTQVEEENMYINPRRVERGGFLVAFAGEVMTDAEAKKRGLSGAKAEKAVAVEEALEAEKVVAVEAVIATAVPGGKRPGRKVRK